MGVKPLQRPCPGGLQLRLHQSSPKSPIHLPTQDLSILCPKGTYVMQYHTRAQIWMEEEVGFHVSNSSLSMCARVGTHLDEEEDEGERQVVQLQRRVQGEPDGA